MRTAETYASSVSSFKRFLRGADINMEDLDSETMMEYEAYLRSQGLSSNTTSFYMRNLRAIYNRAVEKGLIVDKARGMTERSSRGCFTKKGVGKTNKFYYICG